MRTLSFGDFGPPTAGQRCRASSIGQTTGWRLHVGVLAGSGDASAGQTARFFIQADVEGNSAYGVVLVTSLELGDVKEDQLPKVKIQVAMVTVGGDGGLASRA